MRSRVAAGLGKDGGDKKRKGKVNGSARYQDIPDLERGDEDLDDNEEAKRWEMEEQQVSVAIEGLTDWR